MRLSTRSTGQKPTVLLSVCFRPVDFPWSPNGQYLCFHKCTYTDLWKQLKSNREEYKNKFSFSCLIEMDDIWIFGYFFAFAFANPPAGARDRQRRKKRSQCCGGSSAPALQQRCLGRASRARVKPLPIKQPPSQKGPPKISK